MSVLPEVFIQQMKANILLLICVLSLSLAGCDWFGNSPDFNDDFISYIIRPGNHEAENTTAAIKFQTSRTLDFQAIFDESAKYVTTDPGNAHDINKLLGFSDCGAHHHGSSVRFGWNWMDGQVKIYTYVYSNGVRIPEKFMGAAEIGKIHRYKIEITSGESGDLYKFTMDDHVEFVPRECSGGGILPSYRLFPYFGGDETAPQEIKIKVRILE